MPVDPTLTEPFVIGTDEVGGDRVIGGEDPPVATGVVESEEVSGFFASELTA